MIILMIVTSIKITLFKIKNTKKLNKDYIIILNGNQIKFILKIFFD